MSDTPANPESTTTPSSAASNAGSDLGRNEPCHCGSGKKYKRCHGVDAAPKLSTPAAPVAPAGGAGAMGFDPAQMDPAMMQQMTKALQRLPRPQLMRLQGIMQRAMAGQDVAKEAAEFERILPPEFSQMAMQMMMAQGMAGGAAAGGPTEMNADEAKQIVAKAVAEGKMTAEQAKELLGGEDPQAILEKSEKKGLSGLFKKITGK